MYSMLVILLRLNCTLGYVGGPRLSFSHDSDKKKRTVMKNKEKVEKGGRAKERADRGDRTERSDV
jgi:hypothetical protein